MHVNNIIFVSVDSLRQDKCYGISKNSFIPNLEKLIKNGTFFTQTIASAPKTIPSLSSIFSGLYPFESTVQDNDLFNLNPNLDTFVSELEKAGFISHAIIPDSLQHTNITKQFSNTTFFNSFASLYDENLGEKIIQIINNLSSTKPWFLFIHLQDLHGNAVFHLEDAPTEFDAERFGKNPYEKMLSAMDPWLGKIFDCIDFDKTLCVLASDHGSIAADFNQEMADFCLENSELKTIEPGLVFKSTDKIVKKFPKKLASIKKTLSKKYTSNKKNTIKKRMDDQLEKIENFNLSKYQKRLLKMTTLYPRDCYDESFRPALLFVGAKIPSGRIISNQTRLLDIFPTLFEILNIETKIQYRGRSLFPEFNNKSNLDSTIMIDSASSKSESNTSDTIGIRTKKFKYFRDRLDETKNVHLYDLELDPHEENNIFESNPKIIKQMENELYRINNDKNFSYNQINEISESDAQNAKELLKDLGYV